MLPQCLQELLLRLLLQLAVAAGETQPGRLDH